MSLLSDILLTKLLIIKSTKYIQQVNQEKGTFLAVTLQHNNIQQVSKQTFKMSSHSVLTLIKVFYIF